MTHLRMILLLIASVVLLSVAISADAAPHATVTGTCPNGVQYAALTEADIPCPAEELSPQLEGAPHTPPWLDVLVVRPFAVIQVGIAGIVYYIALPIIALTDYPTEDWRHTMLDKPVYHLMQPLGSY